MSAAISGPIALYNNFPINAQYYQPRQYFISNVTLGQTTIVTTTVDNDYVIGQLVRLIIPPFSGCWQLNEQQGYVISLSAPNQVEIEIDSSLNVAPFKVSSFKTQPQILAIGDIANGTQNSNGRVNLGTFIPGAFINISPN